MVFLVTKAALAATIVGVGVTFGALSYLARRNQEQNSSNGLQPNGFNHETAGSNRGFPSFSLFPSSNDPPSSPQGNSPLFSFPSRGFRLFGSSPMSSSFLRDCDCKLIHECSTFFGGASHSFRFRRTCGFQGFQRKICCDEEPAFFSTPPPNFALDNVRSMHEHFSNTGATGCKHNHDANGGIAGCNCDHYQPFDDGGGGKTGDVTSSTLSPGQVQDEEERPVKQGTSKPRLNFPEINEYFRDDIQDKSDKEEDVVPIEAALFPDEEDNDKFTSEGRNHRINLAFGEDETEDSTYSPPGTGDSLEARKVPSLLEYFPEEGSAGLLANLATTTVTPPTIRSDGNLETESTSGLANTKTTTEIEKTTSESPGDVPNEEMIGNMKDVVAAPPTTTKVPSTTEAPEENDDKMRGFFDMPTENDEYILEIPETSTVKKILTSEPPLEEDFPDVTESLRHGGVAGTLNLERGDDTLVKTNEEGIRNNSTSETISAEAEITMISSNPTSTMRGKPISEKSFNEDITTARGIPTDTFASRTSTEAASSYDAMEKITTTESDENRSSQSTANTGISSLVEEASSTSRNNDIPDDEADLQHNDETPTTIKSMNVDFSSKETEISNVASQKDDLIANGIPTFVPTTSESAMETMTTISTVADQEGSKESSDTGLGLADVTAPESSTIAPPSDAKDALQIMKTGPDIINFMFPTESHEAETTISTTNPEISQTADVSLETFTKDIPTMKDSEIPTTTPSLHGHYSSTVPTSITENGPVTDNTDTILDSSNESVDSPNVQNLEKSLHETTTHQVAKEDSSSDKDDDRTETTTAQSQGTLPSSVLLDGPSSAELELSSTGTTETTTVVNQSLNDVTMKMVASKDNGGSKTVEFETITTSTPKYATSPIKLGDEETTIAIRDEMTTSSTRGSSFKTDAETFSADTTTNSVAGSVHDELDELLDDDRTETTTAKVFSPRSGLDLSDESPTTSAGANVDESSTQASSKLGIVPDIVEKEATTVFSVPKEEIPTTISPELATGKPSTEPKAVQDETATLSLLNDDDIVATTTIPMSTEQASSPSEENAFPPTESSTSTTDSDFTVIHDHGSATENTVHPTIESLIASSTPMANKLDDGTTTPGEFSFPTELQSLQPSDSVRAMDAEKEPEVSTLMSLPSLSDASTMLPIDIMKSTFDDEIPVTKGDISDELQKIDHTSEPSMQQNDFDRNLESSTALSKEVDHEVTTTNPLADQSFTTTIQSIIDDLITMISVFSTTISPNMDVLHDMQTATLHPNDLETTTLAGSDQESVTSPPDEAKSVQNTTLNATHIPASTTGTILALDEESLGSTTSRPQDTTIKPANDDIESASNNNVDEIAKMSSTDASTEIIKTTTVNSHYEMSEEIDLPTTTAAHSDEGNDTKMTGAPVSNINSSPNTDEGIDIGPTTTIKEESVERTTTKEFPETKFISKSTETILIPDMDVETFTANPPDDESILISTTMKGEERASSSQPTGSYPIDDEVPSTVPSSSAEVTSDRSEISVTTEPSILPNEATLETSTEASGSEEKSLTLNDSMNTEEGPTTFASLSSNENIEPVQTKLSSETKDLPEVSTEQNKVINSMNDEEEPTSPSSSMSSESSSAANEVSQVTESSESITTGQVNTSPQSLLDDVISTTSDASGEMEDELETTSTPRVGSLFIVDTSGAAQSEETLPDTTTAGTEDSTEAEVATGRRVATPSMGQYDNSVMDLELKDVVEATTVAKALDEPVSSEEVDVPTTEAAFSSTPSPGNEPTTGTLKIIEVPKTTPVPTSTQSTSEKDVRDDDAISTDAPVPTTPETFIQSEEIMESTTAIMPDSDEAPTTLPKNSGIDSINKAFNEMSSEAKIESSTVSNADTGTTTPPKVEEKPEDVVPEETTGMVYENHAPTTEMSVEIPDVTEKSDDERAKEMITTLPPSVLHIRKENEALLSLVKDETTPTTLVEVMEGETDRSINTDKNEDESLKDETTTVAVNKEEGGSSFDEIMETSSVASTRGYVSDEVFEGLMIGRDATTFAPVIPDDYDSGEKVATSTGHALEIEDVQNTETSAIGKSEKDSGVTKDTEEQFAGVTKSYDKPDEEKTTSSFTSEDKTQSPAIGAVTENVDVEMTTQMEPGTTGQTGEASAVGRALNNDHEETTPFGVESLKLSVQDETTETIKSTTERISSMLMDLVDLIPTLTSTTEHVVDDEGTDNPLDYAFGKENRASTEIDFQTSTMADETLESTTMNDFPESKFLSKSTETIAIPERDLKEGSTDRPSEDSTGRSITDVKETTPIFMDMEKTTILGGNDAATENYRYAVKDSTDSIATQSSNGQMMDDEMTDKPTWVLQEDSSTEKDVPLETATTESTTDPIIGDVGGTESKLTETETNVNGNLESFTTTQTYEDAPGSSTTSRVSVAPTTTEGTGSIDSHMHDEGEQTTIPSIKSESTSVENEVPATTEPSKFSEASKLNPTPQPVIDDAVSTTSPGASSEMEDESEMTSTPRVGALSLEYESGLSTSEETPLETSTTGSSLPAEESTESEIPTGRRVATPSMGQYDNSIGDITMKEDLTSSNETALHDDDMTTTASSNDEGSSDRIDDSSTIIDSSTEPNMDDFKTTTDASEIIRKVDEKGSVSLLTSTESSGSETGTTIMAQVDDVTENKTDTEEDSDSSVGLDNTTPMMDNIDTTQGSNTKEVDVTEQNSMATDRTTESSVTDGNDNFASTTSENYSTGDATSPVYTNDQVETTSNANDIQTMESTEASTQSIDKTTVLPMLAEEEVSLTSTKNPLDDEASVERIGTTVSLSLDQDMTTPPNTTPKMPQPSTEKMLSDLELMESGSTMPSFTEMTTTITSKDGLDTVPEMTTKPGEVGTETTEGTSSTDEQTTTRQSDVGSTPRNDMTDSDVLPTTSTKPSLASGSNEEMDITTFSSRFSDPTDTTTFKMSNVDYDSVDTVGEVSPPTFDFKDSSTYLPPGTLDLITSTEDYTTMRSKLAVSKTTINYDAIDMTTGKPESGRTDTVKDEIPVTTEQNPASTVSVSKDMTTDKTEEIGDLNETDTTTPIATTESNVEQTTVQTNIDMTTNGKLYDESFETTSEAEDTTSAAGINSDKSATIKDSMEATTSPALPHGIAATETDQTTENVQSNFESVQTTEGILQDDGETTIFSVAATDTKAKSGDDETMRDAVDMSTTSRSEEDSTEMTTNDELYTSEGSTPDPVLSSDASISSTGETHESYGRTTEFPDLESTMTSAPVSNEAEDDTSATTLLMMDMMSTPVPMSDDVVMGEDGLPVTEITKSIRREPDTDKTVVQLSHMRSLHKNKITKTVTAIKSGSEASVSELTTESPLSTATGGTGTTDSSTTQVSENDEKSTTELPDATTESSSDTSLVFEDVTEYSPEPENTTGYEAPQPRSYPKTNLESKNTLESKSVLESVDHRDILPSVEAMDETTTQVLADDLASTTTEKELQADKKNLSTNPRLDSERTVSSILKEAASAAQGIGVSENKAGMSTTESGQQEDFMTTTQVDTMLEDIEEDSMTETNESTTAPNKQTEMSIDLNTTLSPIVEYDMTTEMGDVNKITAPNSTEQSMEDKSNETDTPSTTKRFYDIFEGRDNTFDFTSTNLPFEFVTEQVTMKDGNNFIISTTNRSPVKGAVTSDVGSTASTTEAATDSDGTTSLPDIVEAVDKKSLNLEKTTQGVEGLPKKTSMETMVNIPEESTTTAYSDPNSAITSTNSDKTTTTAMELTSEAPLSTESPVFGIDEAFNDTSFSSMTTLEPDNPETEAPTTEAALALDTTITNAVLEGFYETLFGPSTLSARAKSLDVKERVANPTLIETNIYPKSTTTPEPRFKVDVKVGPYNERALFAAEKTAFEKQVESEISEVVEQLVLTTHKNFHLLPNFNECARARGRTGRRKTKVLHFDTENYPWMARVGFWEPAGVLFPCAGTIISRRYILTSAHCALRRANGTAEIMEILLEGAKNAAAGMSNQSQFKYKVEEVIPHPNYNMITRENDLALIRLAESIPSFQGSSDVKPICLPFEDGYGVWEALPVAGETAYLGGWGYGLKNMAATVEEMEEAAVTIWSNDNCTHLYRGDLEKRITPQHICAYGRAEKDACRGDSGGPLMALVTKQKIFFQIGIVSYGPRCGYGVPGVYTRVSKYLNWILDTMRS